MRANAERATVKFGLVGVSHRVILSRELSSKEIEIIAEVPDIWKFEVFCPWGTLYSVCIPGRCLLSGYINKRDTNQGTGKSPLTRSYNTHKAEENETWAISYQHSYRAALSANLLIAFVPTKPRKKMPFKTINLNGDV